MMHFTCDLCGKELRPGRDAHFIVKIEAFAVHNPAELTEADLEEDHLEAIGQLLSEAEEGVELPETNQHFRYDLCPECHQKFVGDPLGREQKSKVFFSEN
jgi:hypothetical protein